MIVETLLPEWRRIRLVDQGKQPSMRESLDASLEIIAEDSVLKALLNVIPSVGGSLTELMAGKGQRILEERRDKLLGLMAEHIAVVEESAIRSDYFETPEGFDLLIKALDESRRTGSDEKRDLIARVLAGAASGYSEQGNYTPEQYLNIVAGLTPKELEVARTVYELQTLISPKELGPENRMETWRLCEASVREKHEIDADDLPLLLNRIASTGLVDLVYVQYAGSAVPTYWVSPAFRKLIDFLRLGV